MSECRCIKSVAVNSTRLSREHTVGGGRNLPPTKHKHTEGKHTGGGPGTCMLTSVFQSRRPSRTGPRKRVPKTNHPSLQCILRGRISSQVVKNKIHENERINVAQEESLPVRSSRLTRLSQTMHEEAGRSRNRAERVALLAPVLVAGRRRGVRSRGVGALCERHRDDHGVERVEDSGEGIHWEQGRSRKGGGRRR